MEGSSLKRSFIDSIALDPEKDFQEVSCILFDEGSLSEEPSSQLRGNGLESKKVRLLEIQAKLNDLGYEAGC